MYPRSMFTAKNKKIITIFHLKIIIFSAVKNQCIAWACFRNETDCLHRLKPGFIVPGSFCAITQIKLCKQCISI